MSLENQVWHVAKILESRSHGEELNFLVEWVEAGPPTWESFDSLVEDPQSRKIVQAYCANE